MNIYVEKLGCGKNNIDAELMESVLIGENYKIIDTPENADFVIVNTCGFIESAKKEAIDYILHYASMKKDNPDMKLIVTGCLTQRYPGDLFKEIPEIDALLGVYSYNNILSVFNRIRSGEKRILDVGDNPSIIYDSNIKRMNTQRTWAEVKISDGCNNYCSYCIIPYLRGEYKSKRFEKIVEETEQLAKDGVQEIILVGQETTRYGVDLYSKYRLTELIEKLALIDGIKWIRVMYCNIWDIDDTFLNLMNKEPKFLKYIDIPIQNADDDIIRTMNRRGSRKEIEDKIDYMRKKVPGLCIRSTFITGFPGENNSQFLNNLDFINKMKIDRAGVFKYSDEEGTKAFDMENKVDEDVKEERFHELMMAQQEISCSINESFVGKEIEVLVEGMEDNLYIARSYRDAPGIDGYVLIESKKYIEPGIFVWVKIVGYNEYDLYGELI